MVAITIRRAALAAAMLGLVVRAADQARAELITITFDDVSVPSSPPEAELPNQLPGYAGFIWSNFFVSNASTLSTINTPSHVSGVVSPNQAAYNGGGLSATLMSTGGATFDLISASLTSFHMPQTVSVQGFLNGVPIPADNITYNGISDTTHTLVLFDPGNLGLFKGIDEARFSSRGGTPFVMDDLSVSFSAVPELDSFSTASALTLLTSGVLILNGRRKR